VYAAGQPGKRANRPELSSFDARLHLQKYASQAFGVFQKPPHEVVWVFSPDPADDAREHHFHPTERKRLLPDGSPWKCAS
jgi:hypothetical protein